MNKQHKPPAAREKWLMLIFQLPAKPAYLRVKIWRRLQNIGAIAVKNSVYALPANTESQEDLQWLLREIQEGGGEGMVCDVSLIEGLTDAQVRELFDQARDTDYEAIAREAQILFREVASNGAELRLQRQTQVTRLRKRLAEVISIDFFGANGRNTAEGLLAELESRLKEEGPMNENSTIQATTNIPRGLTWVTRQGVKVDRIASAWLIGRFIDPERRLKFVTAKDYVAQQDELRFDMFEAEYTHEGNNCTFEVLLTRAGLADPALRPIAEIVHDIDIKDNKYNREETVGVKTLLASICQDTESDEERIHRGSVLFEDLYRHFQKNK